MAGQAKPHTSTFKRLLVLAAVFFVVVGLASLVTVKVVQAQPCNGRPNSKLYSEAAQAIKSDDASKMKTISDKILHQKNVEKDANCLVPIFSYYIKTKDGYNAQIYLNKIEKVYSYQKGFAAVYKEAGINGLSDLTTQLDNLITKKSNSLNAITF